MRSTIKSLFARIGIAVSRIPRVPPAFADQVALFENTSVRCVVDLGASIGTFAKEYRTLFPQAEVYAFEAFEEHFRQLEANTRHDPLIRPLHLAVSDVIGPVVLNVNRLPDTNSILTSRAATNPRQYDTTGQEAVPSVTLDHFAAAHGIRTIDILKMDIQGAELRALRGATGLLQDRRIRMVYCEVWFREMYDQQPLFHDIARFLQAFDYRLINLYNCVYHGREVQWGDALFASANLGRTTDAGA